MKYRHEIKEKISNLDMKILESRLSAVAYKDPHAGDEGYDIRSVYFDTAGDKALLENLSGVCHREKYRIRYYNRNLEYITLEKKVKDGELGYKEQTLLSKEEAELILLGDYSHMPRSESRLVKELYNQFIFHGLKPVSIVDYKRKPFIFPAGNVRVTLDYDIRATNNIGDFFDKDCPVIPVYDNACILEVKWDEYLPDIIKDAVLLRGRSQNAYSKYVQSRMYD